MTDTKPSPRDITLAQLDCKHDFGPYCVRLCRCEKCGALYGQMLDYYAAKAVERHRIADERRRERRRQEFTKNNPNP